MTLVGRFQFDKETLKKYSNQTIFAGILMMVLGLVGVFAPTLMSVVTVYFLAWLFLFSGIVQGYNTWKSYNGHLGAWLKPTISIITAFLLMFFPLPGVAATAILLVVYLLMDAYSSLTLGWQYRPNKGWWLMLVNGILSIVLAIILLIGWPVSSLVLVGLFVGISLFFDGAALVGMGLGARKIGEDEIKEQKEANDSQKKEGDTQ
ncbi:HdeD family acid-resistance protein [Hydrogenimonas sp. SS33]|uniref:HdeD family acid-resistance protein n=1 Tax=Hydrogenimonas leucolamina TaxID=2954236 RepID=UPI00336C2625